MIADQIRHISDEFIAEAKGSPRLLADMAAMEIYLAESYGERILIELLQNADDAQSSKAVLKVVGDTVLFANNGRPFSEKDLIAICRSGSSEKKRGKEIGYRGVGFKSTTSLSNDIIISSDNTFFSFSKNRCAIVLGMKESQVPTIRIPFLVEKAELDYSVFNTLQALHQQGYNTIFVFKNSKTSIIEEEIKMFDKSSLLFLRNITELIFESGNTESYSVKRSKDVAGVRVVLSSASKQDYWLIPEVNQRTNFAFKMDENEHIIECNSQEAVFHCYLPTLDAAPFRIKINSDFSTDPSRKHLTLDGNTKSKLNILSDDLKALVQACIDGVIPYNEILPILSNRVSYSQAATFLYDAFADKVLNTIHIVLNDGRQIKIEEYKQQDEFLSLGEKQFISENSKAFIANTAVNNNLYLQQFIERFSKAKYILNDYFNLLLDKPFAEKCDASVFAKIYSYVLKGLKIDSLITGMNSDFSNCLVQCSDGIKTIISLQNGAVLNSEFMEQLKNYVAKDDWSWFVEKCNISFDLYNDSKLKTEIKTLNAQVPVSKWRSAEQQCVDIEIAMGNTASYVGSKNLGYDVESKMPNGRCRYIEVKLLSSDNGNFTMTNNEYSAAHQFGDDYYMCIIVQKDTGLKVTYIQNPLQNISLEKRVRQWEWFCESFSGEEFLFHYESK